MELNKKGFMMAEVVVVSAIVLTFLASIFISYNKIYSAYKTRLNYYDVTAVYRLDFYRDYYMKKTQDCSVYGNISIYDCNLRQAQNSGKVMSRESNGSKQEMIGIFYTNYSNLTQDILKNENVNLTYKDYVNYLATSVDFTDVAYVMTLETCESSDVCKYSYIKLDDGVVDGE